jgi:hypothetical protein
MVTTKVQFRTAMRKAAVDLLKAYADGSMDNLQVYEALPTSFYPPTAFVDRIDEVASFSGPTQRQRTLRVQVVLLYRLFAENERGDAAAQLDAFVDGFSDWVLENYHQPGPTELISVTRIDDEPQFVVQERDRGKITYFAARITLEGYTGN